MKKVDAFNKAAEIFPWPTPASPFIFNKHMVIFKTYSEPILKSGGLAVNNIRKHKPKRNH